MNIAISYNSGFAQSKILSLSSTSCHSGYFVVDVTQQKERLKHYIGGFDLCKNNNIDRFDV